MEGDLKALLDLQDVDGRIRELEQESRDLPQRRAQAAAHMKGALAEVSVAKNLLTAAQERVATCDGEAAAAEKRIQELKIQQATASSNKEYQQLMMSIESLEQEVDGANRRAEAARDELPRLERKVTEAEERLGSEQGGVDDQCAEFDARLAEVKQELAELTAGRKEQAAKVSVKTLLYYERLRLKRWPVLVPLNADAVCEGCHLKVPPSTEQMVQHKLSLVACTNCGRMLYRDL